MTTIAYDGKTLATDSLVTSGSTFDGYADKSFIMDNEVFAFAGAQASFDAWINWWLDDKDPKNIPLTGDTECNLVILNPEGIIEVHSNCPYPIKAGVKLPDGRKVFATGSGYELALGAMFAGANASEAVNAAKFFDEGTGGDIKVINLPWIKSEAV